MTITFDRPIGAHADISELEYVAALHQSCMPNLRTDGSIHAEDIVNYLVSRHGIRTTVEVVNDQILNNLAGNIDSQQPPILDVAEVTSILLIPHLKRATEQQEEKTDFFDRIHYLFQTIIPLENCDHETNEKGELLLTPALVQTFLEELGEYDVPPQIVQELIAHASDDAVADPQQPESEESDEAPETARPALAFTVETLIRALTKDLGPYDTSREAKLSTHAQDVLASTEKEGLRTKNENEPDVNTIEKTSVFKRVFTAPSIDHGADTFASPTWVVLVWILLVILYLSYISGVTSANFASLDCNTHLRPFGCNVVNGIITWGIIFLQLTILGVAFVTLTSLGNSVYDDSHWLLAIARTLVAIVTIFATCIMSLFVEIQTPFFSTVKRPGYEAAYYGCAGFALMLISIQLLELVRAVLGSKFLDKHPRLQRFLTAGSIRKEGYQKQAAAFKVNRMINNALEIHGVVSTKGSMRASASGIQSNPMFKFQMMEHRTEVTGGAWWGWKRIWNGSVAREEGVWLHARLWACNMAQLFVTIFILVLWALLLRTIRSSHAEKEDGFKIPVTVAELNAALTLGALAALFSCMATTLVFVPSFISTCIQFRSGLIPALRGDSFHMYRFAEDNTSVLFGSCFWGMWSTGFVCWALVGLVTFLAVWHVTRDIVIFLISNVLGLVITLVVKLIILMVLRQTLYRAFYRKHPAFANLVSVAMECWNLGLSTGYMVARTAQLLMVTAFYLGRLDTPVLAPGVGQIGPLVLDSYPIIFRKDLLLHDAHRHPYIERLGMMYMMKLFHGDAFANRAGSCWRLLTVLVLMPWLRKYRIQSIEELQMEQIGEGFEDAVDDEELQHQKEIVKKQEAAGGDDNREFLLEREVGLLRKRSHLQQKEIDQLRKLLEEATRPTEVQETPADGTTNGVS